MAEVLRSNSRNYFDFRHLEHTSTIEIYATGPSPYLSPQAGRGAAGVEPFLTSAYGLVPVMTACPSLMLAPLRLRGDEQWVD